MFLKGICKKTSCNLVNFVDKYVFILISIILLLFTFVNSSAAQFTAAQFGDYGNVTVMEVEGNYDAKLPDGTNNDLPRQVIAKEFYRLHKDEYDFLVIFSNFNFAMPAGDADAYYSHVKNDTQGIGLEIFDNTSFYGSNGKLQGTVDMGNIAGMTVDPFDPDFEHTLSTLNHELMHRWGAYVHFREADGAGSIALLGKKTESLELSA
ncbi:hypothetical protein BMS3Abin07_01059 [bacterium BMS3Abin07]|nr:hypothetical protein BMS3Abin07_01059 [bacterium BMS3Abin07]